MHALTALIGVMNKSIKNFIELANEETNYALAAEWEKVERMREWR